MRRRTSPVQQWVDSLPSPVKSPSSLGSITRQQSVSVDSETTSIPECSIEQSSSEKENYIGQSNMTVSTPITVPNSPAISYPSVSSKLARDPSFQSDSSHCSSVESLLELRRPDPEAVLLSLGFGGGANTTQESGPLARIPKRFLQPSRLKGIAIDDFVRHQHETSESLDSTSLGYRGLTGSPYVAPSEIVQKIMQRLREHESHELDMYAASLQNNNLVTGAAEHNGLPPQQLDGRLSVLSPDNRQFLDRPRSKSPDMRNKRMIIGQRSFAFGRDGDLIEINPRQDSQESDDVFEHTNNVDIEPTSEMGPTISTITTIVAQNVEPTNSKQSLINTKSNEDVVPVTNNNNSNTNNNNNIHSNSDDICSSQDSVDRNHNYKRSAVNYCDDEAPRRASEGCSSSSNPPDLEEGRRFSDSVLTQQQQSSDAGSRKRNLKRQARIREIPVDDGTITPFEEEESQMRSRSRSRSKEARCVQCGGLETKCESSVSKEDVETEASREVGCCCYTRNADQTCWREMEKVLQKNKKLEDTVNKSRQEMAEIRDMLSSVLSVRMEPGF